MKGYGSSGQEPEGERGGGGGLPKGQKCTWTKYRIRNHLISITRAGGLVVNAVRQQADRHCRWNRTRSLFGLEQEKLFLCKFDQDNKGLFVELCFQILFGQTHLISGRTAMVAV